MSRTPRQEMLIMARALATAMGREFHDGSYPVPDGAWYIERADTEKALYRLAEQSGRGVNHPITSAALSSQALADACYFARCAVGIDRDETRQIAQTIGAMRRGDTEFITTETVHERSPFSHLTVERVVSALRPCWSRA